MNTDSTTRTNENTQQPWQPPALGLGRRLIGEEETALVLEALKSGSLNRFYPDNNGDMPQMAERLEAEIAEKIGVDYALAVTSGTAALQVALGALGVGPGDEVILPAWSWVSCFTSVVRAGARPVLVEVDESLCIDLDDVKRRITERTKAVIAVHFQGGCAELCDLQKICAEHKIYLLEDVAESPGASYKDRRLGAWGDIAIFSFQYQKSITCGEGGAVVTNNPVLFERAVRMHDIGGFRVQFHDRLEPTQASFCGENFRMPEIVAAVALAQWRKLDGLLQHVQQVRDRVKQRLSGISAVRYRPIANQDGESGYEIYLILPDKSTADGLREHLKLKKIVVQQMTKTYPHYAREYCLKGLAHYGLAACFEGEEMPLAEYTEDAFPQTASIIGRFVAIPLGLHFTLQDADFIGMAIAEYYSNLDQ